MSWTRGQAMLNLQKFVERSTFALSVSPGDGEGSAL